MIENLCHLRVGEAGSPHRADRIEIGGRKRVVAAEQHAFDADRLREPAQMHRTVHDRVVVEAADIGRWCRFGDVTLGCAVHARMQAVETAEQIGKGPAAMRQNDAQSGKPVEHAGED